MNVNKPGPRPIHAKQVEVLPTTGEGKKNPVHVSLARTILDAFSHAAHDIKSLVTWVFSLVFYPFRSKQIQKMDAIASKADVRPDSSDFDLGKTAILPPEKLEALSIWANTPVEPEGNVDEMRFDESPKLTGKNKEALIVENRAEAMERIITAYEYDPSNLDLSNLGLTSLPSILKDDRFKEEMISLNLSGNRLKTIPDPVLQLSQLQTLIVRNNRLNAVSPEIANLKNLQCFIYWGNNLDVKNFPDALKPIVFVQAPAVDATAPASEEKEIEGIVFEKALRLWIDDTTENVGVDKEKIAALYRKVYDKKLDQLDLKDQSLTSLPDIYDLTIFREHLVSLNLSGNKLKELPKALSQLDALTTLIVTKNQLTDISDDVIPPNLKFVMLWGNKISVERTNEINQILAAR